MLILFLQEIHKKIMSLNFRDCHAKIRQVDSQATVGNAVVVQVCNEHFMHVNLRSVALLLPMF